MLGELGKFINVVEIEGNAICTIGLWRMDAHAGVPKRELQFVASPGQAGILNDS